MTIQRLQHASVPRPPGQQAHEQAIAFYSGVLGLEHVPKPRTFTDIEVTWFKVGDQEIHVYAAEGDSLAESGAHFCLVVDDLDATRRVLESAGYACSTPAPIPHRPRMNSHDPFGNRIELTVIEGDYLAE